MQEEEFKHRNKVDAGIKKCIHTSIARKITGDLINGETEFHSFSDASEVAYGCCLYLRCVNSDHSFIFCII